MTFSMFGGKPPTVTRPAPIRVAALRERWKQPAEDPLLVNASTGAKPKPPKPKPRIARKPVTGLLDLPPAKAEAAIRRRARAKARRAV
jgi:hypothetical protein